MKSDKLFFEDLFSVDFLSNLSFSLHFHLCSLTRAISKVEVGRAVALFRLSQVHI